MGKALTWTVDKMRGRTRPSIKIPSLSSYTDYPENKMINIAGM